MNKFAQFALAFLLTLSFSSPIAPIYDAGAAASDEQRLRTDAIEIYLPKNFAVPVKGCSYVPVKFRWRYFYSQVTNASVWLVHPNKDQIIGGITIWAHKNPGEGSIPLKICSYRWLDSEATDFYSRAKKRAYEIDLWVMDFDNKTDAIQLGPDRKIRLR